MSTLKVNAISDAAAANGNAITLATDGTCTAKITNNLSNRNLIINGAMQVCQRSGGSVTANGYQTVDRWYLSAGGTDEGCTQKPTSLGASDAGPFEAGFRTAYQIKNGNQTSGAGAADWVEIQYNIEAQDLACSGWDYTEPTSYTTLSFWVKSTVAQTYHCYLQTVDGTAQLYAFSFTLAANTWKKVTKTIPGNANLQFDYDTNNGLRIGIVPFYGTNYTSSGFTLNAWAAQSGSSMMPDNTSTWYTTNDAEFELTGVQLEVGDVATDFEHRSYGDELARCQRYFYKMPIETNGPPAYQYYPTHKQSVIQFPTEMRTTPTCTATWSSSGTFSQYHLVKSHFKAYVGSNYDTAESFYIQTLTASAEL